MSSMNPDDPFGYFVQAATIARVDFTLFDSDVDPAAGIYRLPDEYIMDLVLAVALDILPEDEEAVARLWNVSPEDLRLFFWRGSNDSLHLAELYLHSSDRPLEIRESQADYLEQRVRRAAKNQTDIISVTEYDKARYRQMALGVDEATALIKRQAIYNEYFGEEIITPLEETA